MPVQSPKETAFSQVTWPLQHLFSRLEQLSNREKSWIPTSHDVWLQYFGADMVCFMPTMVSCPLYPLSSLPHSPFRCIPWYLPKILHSTFNRNPTEDRWGSRPVSLALPLEHGDLDEFHGDFLTWDPATGWNHHEFCAALSSKLLHWYVLPGQWIGSAWPVQMMRKEREIPQCNPEKTVINQPQSIPSLVFFQWHVFRHIEKHCSFSRMFYSIIYQYDTICMIYHDMGFTTLRMIGFPTIIVSSW